jgi:hypothetical protein
VYHKTNNLKTFAPWQKRVLLCVYVGNKFSEMDNKKVKEEEVSWLNGNTGLPFL